MLVIFEAQLATPSKRVSERMRNHQASKIEFSMWTLVVLLPFCLGDDMGEQVSMEWRSTGPMATSSISSLRMA